MDIDRHDIFVIMLFYVVQSYLKGYYDVTFHKITWSLFNNKFECTKCFRDYYLINFEDV